jgi:hypothetical protein
MSGWRHIFDLPDPDLEGPKDHHQPSHFMSWMVNNFGRINYSESAGLWRYSVKQIWVGKPFIRVSLRHDRDAVLFKLRWM